MTVDLSVVRDHVGPGPSDAELTRQLSAALEAIVGRYGPVEATEREYVKPFGQWVRLGLRASAVTTVLEGETAVTSPNYVIWPGGFYLRRLDDDGDPIAWTDWVDVIYTPLSEASERDRVTLALIDLEINRSPGLTGITVGPWSEQYAQQDDAYVVMRKQILDSMRPAKVGTW